MSERAEGAMAARPEQPHADRWILKDVREVQQNFLQIYVAGRDIVSAQEAHDAHRIGSQP